MKNNKKKKKKKGKRNKSTHSIQNDKKTVKSSSPDPAPHRHVHPTVPGIEKSSSGKDEISFENTSSAWDEKLAERSIFSRILSFIILLILLLIIPVSFMVRNEFKTSELQAKYFHAYSKKVTSEVKPGTGEPYPAPQGPYDKRLGYADLPLYHERLLQRGYLQKTHSEISEEGYELLDYGLTFPYRAKTRTGLSIKGQHLEPLYSFNEPRWIFPDFESISSLIVNTLLFIEDRSLLDKKHPKKNPAVEWDRFFKALSDLVLNKLVSQRKVPGGSTLATQIEKYQHSSGGRTSTPGDKIRQMISASLKAYHESENTEEYRKNIALDYINSVPLAAMPGHGEIHGLSDGLWAYFGEKPETVNELLSRPSHTLNNEEIKAQGKAFKQILSLFLAHRRPSDYLDDNPQQLYLQVDKYLPLLFREGVISYPLYKAALAEQVPYRRNLPLAPKTSFASRKGPTVVRTHLLNTLKVPSLYELDRLDLQIQSSINVKVQEEVTNFFLQLQDKDGVKKMNLDGFRLLSTTGDPSKVIYSMTLFEQEDGINKLRVQTDTLDQPFNINEGVKLDLGSTAKFRTIITYLEVIEEIFLRFSGTPENELSQQLKEAEDPLSKWVLEKMIKDPSLSVTSILEQAMQRTYSANPGERFFTAGGMHTFENFNKDDNKKTVTIAHALRHSINLPFIRLMRDIVRYFSFHTLGSSARTLKGMSDETRIEYLERFADKEGKIFLGRFYEKYRGKDPEEIISILMDSVKRKPSRFASIYWFLFPETNLKDFTVFMKRHVDPASISEKELQKYFDWYSVRAKTLGDKGYLAKMHPLELWTAAYLFQHPGANLSDIFLNSKSERIEVYDWLMRTSRKHAQDSRIKIILEVEAFTEIHQRWKHMGYPLPSLVPSYATALGTSADRPDALAELMGIILNDGVRYPKTSIESLTFGKDTPYESSYEFTPGKGVRVLSEEVAKAARDGLFDIASNGTAIRLKDGIIIGDSALPVGGKTGTGDHRYVVYRGGVKEKRVVNRTATFMFILGDKYFGVVSAFVPGSEAAQFKFTSALPVQILKLMSPHLNHLSKSTEENST
jgi:membrane peptidoglycan carboxypeptidase